MREAQVPLRPSGDPVFVENRGQWSSESKFLLRGPGLRTWITSDGVVYDFRRTSEVADTSTRGRGRRTPGRLRRQGHVIRLRFHQALDSAVTYGVEPSGQRVNYFLGSDSTRWASNAAAYHRVVTQGLYDRIDAVHYTDGGNPRYDLIVHPGGRPSTVELRIDGARGLLVDADGQLRMESSIGDLYQGRPYAYQEIDGRRVEIPCSFNRISASRVQFALGTYDTTRTLVIDPVIYSTFVGGGQNDHAHGVAIDRSEKVYVVGYSTSVNYPTTTGAYDTTDNGDWDAVITCLDRLGKNVLFSSYYGDAAMDLGTSIALTDSTITISGNTTSGILPGVSGRFDTTNNGQDAFAARFTKDGSTLLAATYLGGSGEDWSNGIAVNSSDQVVIVGGSSSTNFPLYNAIDSSSALPNNGFLTILSPNLDSLAFSTYVCGQDSDYVDGIALDGDDIIHIAGGTKSANFRTTTGAFDTTHNGGGDAYYRKYDSDGTPLLYSTFLGGSSDDRAFAVAVDTLGNAWVTGYTSSSNFPVLPTGVLDTTLAGYSDVFVTRFDTSGGVSFSTFLGGAGVDTAYAIAIDSEGSAYVCGAARSGFPTVAGSFDATYGGMREGFLAVINATGTTLRYSTYLGDSADDGSDAVAVCGVNHAVVVGSSASPRFPVTAGAYDTAHAGNADLTVTRLYTIADSDRVFALGYINDYFPVFAIESCGECLYLPNSPSAANHPIGAGDRVLIMQMAGAEFARKNDRSYGTTESYGRAGLFEFATVASVTDVPFEGHTAVCVALTAPRLHDYRPIPGLSPVQLIRVPQYFNVDLGLVSAPDWNGSIGGVVALEASGEVRIIDDIDVSGAGFAGGASGTLDTASMRRAYDYEYITSNPSLSGRKGEGIGRVAEVVTQPTMTWSGRGPSVSGGGGGNARGAGGGGGSNLGAGGLGGWQAITPIDDGCGPLNVGGLGGRSLSYVFPNAYPAFMGGGGGGGHVLSNDGASPLVRTGGHGGAGGGIVIVRADRLTGVMKWTGAPAIRANGETGGASAFAGAGGGGAGGTLLLAVPQLNIGGDLLLTANGGAGGSASGTTTYCYGPGGGGGGGYTHVGVYGVDNDRVLFAENGGAAGRTLDPSGVACSCSSRVETFGAQNGALGRRDFTLLLLPGTPMPLSSLPVESGAIFRPFLAHDPRHGVPLFAPGIDAPRVLIPIASVSW